MVLGGCQRKDRFSVRKGEIRSLLPHQIFLDHNPIACLPEHPLHHHLIDRPNGLFHCFAEDHPFACGQAVSLHHDGGALFANIVNGLPPILKNSIGGSGKVVLLHHLLGKGFASFEFRSFLARSENGKPF